MSSFVRRKASLVCRPNGQGRPSNATARLPRRKAIPLMRSLLTPHIRSLLSGFLINSYHFSEINILSAIYLLNMYLSDTSRVAEMMIKSLGSPMRSR
jgi:hypothetical protein